MRLSIIVVLCWISLIAAVAAQGVGERVPETSPSDSGRNSDLESRGGTQIVFLGSGRGRLRVPLDVSEQSVADEAPVDETEPRSSFLVDWLRAELPERFGGLDSVELVETRLRRDGGRGIVETRRRELELRGKVADLKAAAVFVDELLALRRVRIHVVGRFLVRPKLAGESWEGRVQLLDLAALKALEDELVESSAREFNRLDFDLVELDRRYEKKLDELRFVRRYEVARLEDGEVVLPVLGSVFEGAQGSAAGFLLPGARQLALALDLGLGVLVRPVPKREVELLGNRHEVLEPELATRRWRNERILLGPDDVGLVVRGLPFPGSEGTEREAREELVLVVNVEIEPLPRRTRIGRILGRDADQNIAFARVAPDADVHPGMRLALTRNNRLVGRVEVLEVLGSAMTLRPLEGRPQRHDELR